ncbi:MAG: hypothetical protein NTZ04_02500 [Chloroflexi bacterium]|nr:hypothetical protein [Chloroflexota bacterium]
MTSSLSEVECFKETLKKYGLTDSADVLLKAIRASYLSAGRLAPEVASRQIEVLQQLGVGWPTLSERGKVIGRELVDIDLKASEEVLNEIVSRYPPAIVGLFLRAASQGADVYSLRVPEDAYDFDGVTSISSSTDLIGHRRILPHITHLGSDLAQQQLAIEYKDRAYKGAKWVAVFIYLTADAAEKLRGLVGVNMTFLDEVEDAIQNFNLLGRSPVPTLAEFERNGVSREMLEGSVKEAIKEGIVTKVVNDGPAFLVIDRDRYKAVVFRPLLDQIIEMLLRQGSIPEKNPWPVVPKKQLSSASPDSKGEIILGVTERAMEQGLLGWVDKRRVLLSLSIGLDEETGEEKSQTISVFGVQGSGKSYTTGVILEMGVMSIPNINQLTEPLAAVVFHYSKDEGYPPEYLGLRSPNRIQKDLHSLKEAIGAMPQAVEKVICLVPTSRLEERRRELPGIDVHPLLFNPNELSTDDWQLLMGVPGSDTLYMEYVKAILQDLKPPIGVESIWDTVERSEMSSGQKRLVALRLELAQRYLHEGVSWNDYAQPGLLTILDIRDKMIDELAAMRLCLVSLRRFQNLRLRGQSIPKLVVLDEAHKYLHTDFAQEVETLVREMRHKATALVIASQDPLSIPDKVIGLSSIVILHRMTSPDWLRHIKRGCAAVANLKPSDVSSLGNGEAYVWAKEATDRRFTEGCVKTHIRPRVTQHGFHSIH